MFKYSFKKINNTILKKKKKIMGIKMGYLLYK